ncbi:HlyD family secretion protein [Pseudoduganella sp.]|uniref:HlyD family secretion protein n=1 Tax=Pseudoduganella sp. TaxID=1880898 RepID=UPI0035B28C3F
MSRRPLFRAAALRAARPDEWLGQPVLLQPLSMRLIAWTMVAFAVCLLAFIFHAEYTRRVPASGVLAPDAGLLKVQSPQPGVILERRVREGQQVQAGEVLYVVSSEVMYAPDGTRSRGAAADTLGHLQSRQSLVQADAEQAAQVAARENAQARARVASLQGELAQLDQSIAVQAERLASKQVQYERHQQAQAQGFLSPLALQLKRDELLEQQSRLHDMQRSRLGLVREMADAQAAVDTAAGKLALARSGYQRQILDIEQDRVAQQTRGRVLVTAPQAGLVTAVLAEPGQRIDGQTLLTIVPAGSQLEAHIFVPSSAIGLIREGDPVAIRLAAYPNEGYGKFEGRVLEVPNATLSPQEQAASQGLAGEARYRVRVGLPAQSIRAAGAWHKLRAGMAVDVRFPQERRTLAGWLFAPLYRLKETL